MPRLESNPIVVPSILDRLLDDEPQVSREPATRGVQSVRDLKKSVARDLEALLNTRQEALEELSPEFVLVGKSLVTYGLPDFTSYNLLKPNDRTRIRRALEQAITTFETRLTRVRVTLEAPREHDRALRFRVDAVLRVDAAQEPVTFNTLLELSTKEYVVEG